MSVRETHAYFLIDDVTLPFSLAMTTFLVKVSGTSMRSNLDVLRSLAVLLVLFSHILGSLRRQPNWAVLDDSPRPSWSLAVLCSHQFCVDAVS
jgi:hypothetical protein